MLRKNPFFIISLFILLGNIWLFVEFKQVSAEQKNEAKIMQINRASNISDEIISNVLKYTKDSILNIKQSAFVEQEINKMLSYYRNNEIKYVYIVYIDEKGAFRYLADGSRKIDKASLHQKFTPALKHLWDRALSKKKIVYSLQDSAEGLWLTHLTPIVSDTKVEAVLVLDISMSEYENFHRLLEPLEKFIDVFVGILILVATATIFQSILFYTQFKRSIIDPLTKLYNRHHLDSIKTSLNNDKISIMMVDIDHFKSINDTYGHAVGDVVISSVAKKLLIATRLEDIVIRYGGEEFLIVVRSAKTKDDVVKIAERVLGSLRENNIRVDDSLSIEVRVSIGLNICTVPFESLDEEIDKADKMLYKAKKAGRNRIEIA